jgi:hypothetical protein
MAIVVPMALIDTPGTPAPRSSRTSPETRPDVSAAC